MPTTSNFGWTTPADTDLVKDGAAAIRTLGNGIDTSLVDLKGGTTGQYLVKQSNTDLDFTWTTNTADIDGITATSPLTGGGTSGTITVGIQDGTTAQKGAVQLTDSISSTSTTTAATPNSVKTAYDLANGAIAKSLVDAKADLITATADNTPARLAVGNNGETLVADSSTSTGLRWQGSYAAGKNFLINGGFDIWQRGTSSGSAGYQTADRWYGNASNSTTFAQETTTIPTDSRFAFKMTAGATAQMWIQQPIETLNAVRLAGRTIAVAADVSASTSTGMTINVYSSTTVDNTAAGSWGSAITATSGGTGTAVSGSFTRISGTYAIPSTAKSVMIQIITTSTVANGVVVYIGNVQAEIGSVPTAFTRAGGNIAGELAACQRYYYVVGGVANGYPIVGGALIATNNQIRFPIKFPTTMRIAPSITKNGTWNVSTNTTQPAAVFIGQEGFSIEISSSSGAVNAAYAYPDSTDDTFTCSSEL